MGKFMEEIHNAGSRTVRWDGGKREETEGENGGGVEDDKRFNSLL